MPFVEVKRPSSFVSILKSGHVTISVDLYRKFFVDKKVKVFHDVEEMKIGLEPSEEGYKITTSCGLHRFRCMELSNITVGRFNAVWSEKHKKIVIAYGR